MTDHQSKNNLIKLDKFITCLKNIHNQKRRMTLNDYNLNPQINKPTNYKNKNLQN
jgi:hypothetical protein